jgi:hypothetical protein
MSRLSCRFEAIRFPSRASASSRRGRSPPRSCIRGTRVSARPGECHRFRPESRGESLTTLPSTAPMLELPTRCGEWQGNIRELPCAYQRFSTKSVSSARPDDPVHRPPIKGGLPAAADHTPSPKSCPAALPEGHGTKSDAIAPLLTVIGLMVYKESREDGMNRPPRPASLRTRRYLGRTS